MIQLRHQAYNWVCNSKVQTIITWILQKRIVMDWLISLSFKRQSPYNKTKAEKSCKLNNYLLSALIVVNTFAFLTDSSFVLQSKIKTQQQYKTSFIPSQQLYFISLVRTASSRETQVESCHVSSKQIVVKSEKQIFRLVEDEQGKQKNREESIFDKITTLDDDENIIEEFELIDNRQLNIFYYDFRQGILPQPIDTTNLSLDFVQFDTIRYFLYQQNLANQYFNIIIRDFKQRALIISSNGISLCRSDQKVCLRLQPFESIEYLFSAEIFTVDAFTYLVILAGESVICYEITASNQLRNRQEYGQQFFAVDKVHIRSMVKAKGNQLLLLDSRRGIVSVKFGSRITNFTSQKLIYEQAGCYQMAGNKKGDQIVLTCTLAAKSFFMQKLARSYSFAEPHYQVIEIIFTSEKIYDTAFVDNFIMSRVYSGVRMYWTSSSMVTPYPYDYNVAGNIFLHNALQSKLKVFQQSGESIIYISTQDQIRMFSLKSLDPYVWCHSPSQLNQQYSLTYSFACANPTPMQRVCESKEQLTYKSWQQGQVNIKTMLIPLMLSLMGVAIITIILFKVYRKYSQDIQRVRLKYSTENEFGM